MTTPGSGRGMTTANDSGDASLRLGDWACLGALYPRPAHGFAIAKRLAPDGDIGRVWSISRALTYRALDALVERGYAAPVADEPGAAGPTRTVLTATRSGRARLRRWVATPVAHVRDLRSELLVKLVVARDCELDVREMLEAQREVLAAQRARTRAALAEAPDDVVAMWRAHAVEGAVRFLDDLRD